jgi:SAM-dependent methyltransferase
VTPFLRGLARSVIETFDLPEPILEVGSYQVEGQEELVDLRSLLAGREYAGLDLRPGPGVDLVGDVERLDLPDGSVGTVLAFSAFEHVPRFWRGFDEVRRVLRPDGAFVVSMPFHFFLHGHPCDYWRFTPEALRLLLEEYPSKLIGWHGTRNRPENVWAVAYREGHAPITEREACEYRRRMLRYARQPMGWFRSLRYLLAGLISGRGPLAPFLDREDWSAEVLNEPAHRRAAANEAARRQRVHRQLELPAPAAGVPPLAEAETAAAAAGGDRRR